VLFDEDFIPQQSNRRLTVWSGLPSNRVVPITVNDSQITIDAIENEENPGHDDSQDFVHLE
jgi:hypothetical protein